MLRTVWKAHFRQASVYWHCFEAMSSLGWYTGSRLSSAGSVHSSGRWPDATKYICMGASEAG